MIAPRPAFGGRGTWWREASDTAHGEYTGFAYGKLISWWDRRVVLFPFQEGG